MDISSFNNTISGLNNNNYNSIITISGLTYNNSNSILTLSSTVNYVQNNYLTISSAAYNYLSIQSTAPQNIAGTITITPSNAGLIDDGSLTVLKNSYFGTQPYDLSSSVNFYNPVIVYNGLKVNGMDISSFNNTISGNNYSNYNSIITISSLVYTHTNSINTISALIPTLQPLLNFSSNIIGNTIDLSNSLIVSNASSYTQITSSGIIMASYGYGNGIGGTTIINKSNLASLDTTTSLTQQLSQFQKSYYYTCGANMNGTTPPNPILNHSCVVAFTAYGYAATVVLNINYYIYQANDNNSSFGMKSNLQGQCLVAVQMDTLISTGSPLYTVLQSTNTALFNQSTLYYSTFTPITIQRYTQGNVGIIFGFPTSFNNSYGGNTTSGAGTSYYINSYGASVEIVSSVPYQTANGYMTAPLSINNSTLGSYNSMRGTAYIIAAS
jgi:hypothetical protein